MCLCYSAYLFQLSNLPKWPICRFALEAVFLSIGINNVGLIPGTKSWKQKLLRDIGKLQVLHMTYSAFASKDIWLSSFIFYSFFCVHNDLCINLPRIGAYTNNLQNVPQKNVKNCLIIHVLTEVKISSNFLCHSTDAWVWDLEWNTDPEACETEIYNYTLINQQMIHIWVLLLPSVRPS